MLPQLLCVFDLSLQDVSLLDRMGFHTFVMGYTLVQHLTQIRRKLQRKAEDLSAVISQIQATISGTHSEAKTTSREPHGE